MFKRAQTEYEPYAVTLDYTFDVEDKIDSLQVDATAGARTITLPTPTGNRRRRILKTDSSANTVTVVGTINGATNYSLNLQYEFVTVEPTGAGWLIVGRGTLTPAVNGIAFPATQVPSSDPNTLDDYEEGTWVPSVGGNATYTAQTGYYTKVGRLVHIHCRLVINVLGTGSASTITTLPYTSLVATGGGTVFWTNSAAAYVYIAAYANGTSVQFTGATAATATLSSGISPLQDGTEVIFNLTYFT